MSLANFWRISKKIPWWVGILSLTLFYSLFFMQKTVLVASDLGRHITNGHIILKTASVFNINLYSYTFPDRAAPNHHWLFGVIAALVHDASGFSGLTLLSVFLYAAAAGMTLWYCTKKYGRLAGLMAGLLVLPLITDRSEVRPEAFSLFFFSLQLCTLFLWHEKKITTTITALIFFVTGVLWVNIHIFFFMEFLILGAVGAQVFLQKNWKMFQQLIFITFITLCATLCNPLGLKGALYPTQILGEYGYRVAENQPPLFFLSHFTRPINWYLVIVFVITSIPLVLLIKKNWRSYTAVSLIFCALLLATNKLIRFENFFGIIAMMTTAAAIAHWGTYLQKKIESGLQQSVYLSVFSFIAFGILTLLLGTGLFFPFNPSFGLGLYPRVNASADFFKSLKITGPLFNNFDIGGYLIYHLYPQTKVYVDNRAEAYPASFLQEYRVAQEDDTAWKKIDDKNTFGAIYFFRLENTEWAQAFLVKRISDPAWVPIYVDDYAIIFVRNIPQHEEVIKKYRLPPELFRINSNLP